MLLVLPKLLPSYLSLSAPLINHRYLLNFEDLSFVIAADHCRGYSDLKSLLELRGQQVYRFPPTIIHGLDLLEST